MYCGVTGSWWDYVALIALLIVLYLPDRPRPKAVSRPASHLSGERQTKSADAWRAGLKPMGAAA